MLLTPEQAAAALNINRSTLYGLLMRGDLPSFTIGRSRRIPVAELEQWINKQLKEQAASDAHGDATQSQ